MNGVQLVSKMCSAALSGDFVGSETLEMNPQALRGGHFTADTKTAGSTALLFQVSFPCCLFSNEVSSLTLKGGTNADMAPQIDYVSRVLLPMMARFGATGIECNIRRRGFFPKGNGEVVFKIPPVYQLKNVQILEFGEVQDISVEAFTAGKVQKWIAEKMTSAAALALEGCFKGKVSCKTVHYDEKQSFGNGCGLNIYATTSTGFHLSSSGLGSHKIAPEEVGRLAGEELAESLRQRVCVDRYMQDQVIILMALAEGQSAVKAGPITLHTETAIHIVELLTKAKFNIRKDGDTNIIECHGVGLKNSYH